MKKRYYYLVLILLISGFLFYNHIKDTSSEFTVDNESIEQAQEVNTIDQARNQVVEKFRNERDIMGTSKFIEDTYKQYPNDEIISTIYNYDTALSCYEFSDNGKDKEWFETAKSYASKISPTYEGQFSDEIIPFVTNLLGDEWNKTREETIKKDEVYSNLTFEDKIEIHRYLQSQYDKYDEQVGGDSGDKYSDQIFEETANKYGISQDNLMKIWIDTDVSSAANRSNNTITEVLSYDATLSFNGEMSLIANSKEVLDRFLNAIADENQGTIDELLQSGQVAQVPVGTHVNIIEKKIGVAKVKILDGIYADNEVWVLIESVHEQ